jgi:hypothetical protein
MNDETKDLIRSLTYIAIFFACIFLAAWVEGS